MGDLGSTTGLERSPGEGKGCPLQYSGLESMEFMDCIVQGVAKSQMTEQLSRSLLLTRLSLLHWNAFETLSELFLDSWFYPVDLFAYQLPIPQCLGYRRVIFQLLSRVQLFVTPWTAARQAFLSFTVSWSLHKLMSIESVILSNHLILCHPLLLLPSIFPSIRVFCNE